MSSLRRAEHAAALAVLGALLAGPAGAQTATQPPAATWTPTAPSNNVVLPSFSLATIEPLLTEIGIRFERRGTAQAPSLLITYPSGRRAALILGACNADASACRSLSLQAGWGVPQGATVQRASDLVLEFNRRYAFARSFVLANGNMALQRYLTADYGFIRGNLAVNLLAFGAQLDLFVNEVLTPLGVR